MEVDDVTAYLDSIDGNDATGVLNDINYPYQTLNAGYYAARASTATEPIDLMAIKGSFNLTANPTVAYNLFTLTDVDSSSMVTIDQNASFQDCSFDIDISIQLTAETGSGISISGFFSSAAGRAISVEQTASAGDANITTIFSGIPNSFTIILSNVEITADRLLQYFNTTGSLITTYPDITMGTITSTSFTQPGQTLYLIEIDTPLGLPSPPVAVIDNTFRTSGPTSAVNYSYYSSASTCNPGMNPTLVLVGSKTGLSGSIYFDSCTVDITANDLGDACTGIGIKPDITLLNTEFYVGNFASVVGAATPTKVDIATKVKIPKSMKKYVQRIVDQAAQQSTFDRSLVITSAFFSLTTTATTGSPSTVPSYVTNTNSFSVVQTNFNAIDIPPTSVMTITVPDVDPLYAVNNDSMVFNNNGAIIYNPVRVSSAYTPPKNFGTLFYVDGSGGTFDITLNSTDV